MKPLKVHSQAFFLFLPCFPPGPPTEAVLEFECKSQERSALSTELRNSRQASKVYVVKGKLRRLDNLCY